MNRTYLLIILLWFLCLGLYGQSVLTQGYSSNIEGVGIEENGNKEGKWIFYVDRANDKKYSEGHFSKGKKVGLWLKYHLDKSGKRIKSKEIYRNDSLFKQTYFDDSRNKIFEIESQNGLSLNTTYFIDTLVYNLPLYYLNNFLNERFENETYAICLDKIASRMKRNNETANMNLWKSDGELIEKIAIAELSIKKVQYKYNSGKITKTYFYEDEFLVREKQIIEGNEDQFKLVYYFPNGNIWKREEYIDTSQKNGKWVENFESGKKKLIRYYKKDLLHGMVKEWNENGDIIKKENYKNGEVQ